MTTPEKEGESRETYEYLDRLWARAVMDSKATPQAIIYLRQIAKMALKDAEAGQ